MGYVLACAAGIIAGFFIALILLTWLAMPREQRRPMTKEEWKSGKRPKEIY